MQPSLADLKDSLFQHYEMRRQVLADRGKYLQREYSSVSAGIDQNLRQLDNAIGELRHEILSMQLSNLHELLLTAHS